MNFANQQTNLMDTVVDVPAELTSATEKFEHSPQGKKLSIIEICV